MKKIIFTLILLIGFVFTGFSQSEKMKEKATAKVEKINASIVAGDASLGLSDEQKAKIYEMQIANLKEMKVLKKTEADKEKRKVLVKALRKKTGKEISNTILTKEQKQARKKGKQNK